MFRHIVLLTFDPSVPPSQVDDVVAALRTLPGRIPEIAAYEVGIDAGLADGNATVGVVADFADAAGWAVYRDHPDHLAVIRDHIAPIVVSRTALQHER